MVFAHLPPDERRRQIAETYHHVPLADVGPFDGLFGAWRKEKLVGAMFSQTEPGKIAVVYLPRLIDGESVTTAEQLYTATWQLLTRHQIALAQLTLSTVNPTDETLLRSGDFCYLTDLLYLVSFVSSSESNNVDANVLQDSQFEIARHNISAGEIGQRSDITTVPLGQLEFEPYRAACHDEWKKMIRETYEDTLDCAEYQETRNSDEIMEGYGTTGTFDPTLFWLARHHRRAVGCLLLADHPNHNNMELRYLGLIPEVRGRGWGKLLVAQAKTVARRAKRQRLIAAVDAANSPALQTYAAMDFQAWQRRRLYIRTLS